MTVAKTISFAKEPSFDVRLGFTCDGETSYESEFDMPVTKIQELIINDRKRDDEGNFMNDDEYSFIDAVFNNTTGNKELSFETILELKVKHLAGQWYVTSKNHQFLSDMNRFFNRKTIAA